MATFSGTLKRFRVFLDMGKSPLEIVAYSIALFFPFRLKQNMRHSGRAELSQRDGELLRGGLERLGRDGQTVAQLSAQLAKELS